MWRGEDKGQGTGHKGQGTRNKAPDDLGNADEKMKLKISRREGVGKSIKNRNAGILI